ncbi:MAG: hypothetical protein QOD06_2466 [Candidatus Binatota bacterium]|jgi:hypothetical protein|nr:hypothetical protein [Candidatus Binatota bacterium]
MKIIARDRVLAHSANAPLISHFAGSGRRPGLPPVARPEDVEHPYYTLGTHPDLVARLWDELAKDLPTECRAVFLGVPALIHPTTGVVFAFAGGTHTYALRLPQPAREEALQAGAVRIHTYASQPALDVGAFGEEWVLGGWLRGEEAWCSAAYGAAGSADIG